MVGINQSFREVFVASTPTLLPSGTTVDLAVGQVGIFDGKDYKAVATPTYGTNKALYFAWGQPDTSNLPLMSGVTGSSIKTHLIKGKAITGFRGKKASRGRNEIVTIGYDGVDTSKNLSAKCEEVHRVYLRLTGDPVTKMFSKHGLIRQFWVNTGKCQDCEANDETCQDINPIVIADELVRQINDDKELKKFGVRAKKLVHYPSTPSDPSGTLSYTKYQVTQVDNGTQADLGRVQSKYPGKAVTAVGREGLSTTYELTQLASAGSPSALTNSDVVLIPECATCPTGFTKVDGGFIHLVERTDSGANLSSTLVTAYTDATPDPDVVPTVTKIANNRYLVVRSSKITTAASNDGLTFLGEARDTCVLTSPQSLSWTNVETLKAYPKTYRLVVADDECGVSRLADIQAAYPSLVVTQVANTGTESCAHQFQTSILSAPVSNTCGITEAEYTAPVAFEGSEWVEYIDPTVVDFTEIKAGVLIEAAFVHRITNELSYGYFTREYDGVHLEVSEYDPDYNSVPGATYWPSTTLQTAEYIQGDGHFVRKEENQSLGYYLKYYNQDVASREGFGFANQSKLDTFYDSYTIEYSFQYHVGGWGDKYTDNYHLTIYFPEGTGKSFETAINNYLISSNSDITPVIL